MPLTASIVDLGTVSYGSSPLLTFTFQQSSVNTDPGTAALKMTPPQGKSTDYSASLVHGAAGVYTYTFSATAMGDWLGRAYAPPGSGQASIDFVIHVLESANP